MEGRRVIQASYVRVKFQFRIIAFSLDQNCCTFSHLLLKCYRIVLVRSKELKKKNLNFSSLLAGSKVLVFIKGNIFMYNGNDCF